MGERWRVQFLLEEWDELRCFDVEADSEADAKAKAEAEHPWEARTSAATTACRASSADTGEEG